LHRTRGVTLLIAGGARGADSLAEEWAKAQAIPCDLSASWDGLGRKAGPIRNQHMLDEGRLDLVVAFPGGSGTADMLASRRSRLVSGRSVRISRAISSMISQTTALLRSRAFCARDDSVSDPERPCAGAACAARRRMRYLSAHHSIWAGEPAARPYWQNEYRGRRFLDSS
jgi:hypothetical protein